MRKSLHDSQEEADAAKQAHQLAASQVVVLRTEVSALKAQIDRLHSLHGTAGSEQPNIATSPSAPPTVAAAAATPPSPATEPTPKGPAAESEADLPPVA